jgi:hypothetical protein
VNKRQRRDTIAGQSFGENQIFGKGDTVHISALMKKEKMVRKSTKGIGESREAK